MHAESADAAFNRSDWMWEPKLDGYRVLAFIKENQVRMLSRKGLDLAKDFPRLAQELKLQGAPMILDGEVVAFDEQGMPSFHAMQNRASGAHAVFYAFDLLHFAGIDLRRFPYRDRRRYLAQCLLPSERVQLVHGSDDGLALHAAALASGFEGVIGKRKDSRYESGKRSGAWLKVKPVSSAEFVIGGYTRGKGSREAFGALLVGHWAGKKLRFVSGVGSGFDERGVERMLELLKARERKAMPFAEKPDVPGPTTWVEPELVVEVKFQEWTDDGHLRAPVFVRLRDDIEAKDVTSRPRRRASHSPHATEESLDSRLRGNDDVAEVLAQLDSPKAGFTLACGPHRIKLTHLDRVYWPEDTALKQPAVTKRELLRYFAQVSPHMLTHLADRPLTMIRMPDGIGGQRFFQKHWEQERPPFVESVTVFSDSKERQHNYLLCNNLPTLLWLAQNGTLEFHVWHSRAKPGDDSPITGTDYATSTGSLEASIANYPDYVVFDLDPYIYSGRERKGDEPELNTIAFEKGKEVAFWLRELLNTMKLEPIVKTSGKTGLHVFLPIRRTIDFDAAREVSEQVGRHLLRLHPKDITMEWKVEKRTGRIFMDHNMNVRGKTLNSAYSPRGAPGAPVSMPLTWDELAGAHPLDFRITNAPQRLARTGDRWAEALDRKQSLEKALKRKGV
jgi:bifunctional non-homologous end joining protein LigD